jgi:hypothetical protein
MGMRLYRSVLPGDPPFKIWQNGVSTITFAEAMGSLEACSLIFELDDVRWKVWRLQQKLEREKEELKKKDM